MYRFIVIVFFLIYNQSVSLLAQKMNLPKATSDEKHFNYSYLQLDINFLNYPIRHVNTNGLSVSGSAIFGDRLGVGLSVDITDSQKAALSMTTTNKANVFEYTQISLFNEVFFHPNSRIDISLPLKLGLGHASVSHLEGFSFGETLFSGTNIVDEDYFFVTELGANVSVHLIKTLDFNVGGSYRLTAGANGLVGNDDFLNYSIHAGLRFRLGFKQ
ncbi:MAG: hypothetical protein JNL70_27230 [Saprospiraceae bacterium]|nr:hypothetical protein [Saprospiraceae bacterium]